MAPTNRPPELQEIVDEIQRLAPFKSVEEVNRLLAARAQEYNSRPQEELGGLSPDEMRQLLYGDWTSTGALRVNERLAADEVGDAPILDDARVLLDYVATAGAVKETAAGNLPRAAVATLLPRLRIPFHRERTSGEAELRPVNEGDVHWLPELRHVLLFAGLLVRRKGLRITKRGRALLSIERSGELFAILFLTVFRQLDLRVFSLDARHPGLQQTVAYSFYKLRSATRDWCSAETLAEVAWLASAKDPLSELERQYGDFRHYAFMHYVLDPLTQFGLLESRAVPTEEHWRHIVEYRRTPFFDRVLRFEFRREARGDPFLMR